MPQGKKKLHVLQDNGVSDNVVVGTTCFAVHSQHGVPCQRETCQHWFDHSGSQNCVLIAAQKGPHTLQQIGQIYSLTRMRICQIEKGIFEKIKQVTQ